MNLKASLFWQCCLLTFFAVQADSVLAQEHRHITCRSHEVVQELEALYPGYESAVNQTFATASKSTVRRTPNTVYTIPVVLHIVWNTEEVNVADSIIDNQIAVVNEELLAMHEDWHSVRDTFADVVGIPNIQLEVVAIERVNTTLQFSDMTLRVDDQLKDSNNGGSSPWDPDRYLNIWICDMGNPSRAYAYPPVALQDYPVLNKWGDLLQALDPAYDGIAMDYRLFGGRGRVIMDEVGPPILAEGRVLIHELGHYLGLRHIWGDAPSMGFPGWDEVDGCSEAYDDGIQDTPSAWFAADECIPSLDDCALDSMPNMWENYMDYSLEACMVTFTIEQVDLMRSILEGPRSGLFEPTVSVEETGGAFEEDIHIWPNPNQGDFNIAIADHLAVDRVTVRVTDLLGQQIVAYDQEDLGPGVLHVRMPINRQGLYLVHLHTDHGHVSQPVLIAD